MIEFLRAWPQAVSTDDGDLRALHDMANSGAHLWGERLSWPDYLWLDLDIDVVPSGAAQPLTVETYNLMDPTGSGPAKTFSSMKQSIAPSELPLSGQYQISNRVIGMIEMKVIDTDFAPKLAKYRPGIAWNNFVELKFDQWFGKRLKAADHQIAAGKRLLPFSNARGIALIVNERSVRLPEDIVMAYLSDAIHRFQHLDCVVYLADRADGRYAPRLAVKQNDPVLSRFAMQMTMMVSSFDYTGPVPINRSGQQPELLARIEMDARSRQMYRSWTSGWREANDPRPVPSPSMNVTFVRREEFMSGLSKTEPDQSLLDCKFAWDLDPATMTIKNLRIVE